MLLACVLSLGFTSCGGDDDDDSGSSSKTVKSVVASMSYTFSADLLSVADITVTYLDASGTAKTETVSSATWSKTITYTSFPATAGAKITVKRNSTALAKEKYDLTCSPTVSLTVYDSDGKVNDYKSYGSTVSYKGVQAASVESKLTNMFKQFGFHTGMTLSSDKSSITFTELAESI
jgi:uncharacterized protein involved in outer membrane biogenesis